MTNVTISTQEFKGLFTGLIGDRRWIFHAFFVEKVGASAEEVAGSEPQIALHPVNKILNLYIKSNILNKEYILTYSKTTNFLELAAV